MGAGHVGFEFSLFFGNYLFSLGAGVGLSLSEMTFIMTLHGLLMRLIVLKFCQGCMLPCFGTVII